MSGWRVADASKTRRREEIGNQGDFVGIDTSGNFAPVGSMPIAPQPGRGTPSESSRRLSRCPGRHHRYSGSQPSRDERSCASGDAPSSHSIRIDIRSCRRTSPRLHTCGRVGASRCPGTTPVERAGRNVLVRVREHACEFLLSQMKNGNQIPATTHTTTLNSLISVGHKYGMQQ